MARVLVTGGAGAIGSNVVMELLGRGHHVLVLDDLSSGRQSLVPESAQFIRGSVVDSAAVEESFRIPPEYVVHLAALFANQNSIEHPQKDLLVTGLGTLKVLEASQKAGVKKVLFCSSSCVYGSNVMMDEDAQKYSPDTPYAVTKLLGENYCHLWSSSRDLPIAIVRIFNNYGPHEYPGRYRNVIPNFFQIAMRGAPLPITGSGEETRDFNFVSDTVAGILGALFADDAVDTFNIASGQETRIIDLANRINEVTGNRAGIKFRERRKWDAVSRRCGKITKAQEAFGYSPNVHLAEGLEKTFAWFSEVLAAHDA